MQTFSRAVNSGSKWWNWYTKPSERLRNWPRAFSPRADNSSPASQTLPWDGVSRPPNRLSKVLLPEPELPTIATRSPGCSSSCRLDSTTTDSGPSS
eukprot:gene9666-11293_t